MLQEFTVDDDGVSVIPLTFFTSAEVDFSTGGKFLKRLEQFLNQYDEGLVVLGHIDHLVCPDYFTSYLLCPLGRAKRYRFKLPGIAPKRYNKAYGKSAKYIREGKRHAS